ncbi:MAG: branched-chain amino acid ABC transporter permease [Ruminococcaceae bacterium]|nr:branched-chain amino acid ABC transporter permease [Oscillospiraceae bacterium]
MVTLKKHSLAFILLAAFIIVPLTIGNTTDVHNVIIYILIYAMVGEAWNLITGFTGQTSFGHAAYFGVGAYTSTIMLEYFHITPWIGMLVGGVIAVILAFMVNFQMFKLKGHYFAIATLCVAEILKTIFSTWKWVGAGDGIALTPITVLIPDASKNAWGKIAWLSLDVRNRLPFLFTTLAVFCIVFVVCVLLENSKVGFYWKAIRESHEVAESIGINPRNYKLLAMCLSAFIAAIGGTFFAQFFKYIDAITVFPLSVSMIFVLVTVLGGIGNVYGPIIGSVIYYSLELIMRRLTGASGSGLDQIVFGILIVLVTCFEPRGIMGLIDRIKGRFVKKAVKEGEASE